MVLAIVLAVAGTTGAARGAASARAQAAADAAALAAVAESTPLGRGLHRYQARRFAEANGGGLISCHCYPGATAVQVEVSVAGARATARAAFDPDLLMPAVGMFRGLDPLLARSVQALVSRSHGQIHVVSAWRSAGDQRRLWADALQRYGSPERADDWVAQPGRSPHELGRAVDLGGDLDLANRLVAELGLPLHRPLPHEPWHFELIG